MSLAPIKAEGAVENLAYFKGEYAMTSNSQIPGGASAHTPPCPCMTSLLSNSMGGGIRTIAPSTADVHRRLLFD